MSPFQDAMLVSHFTIHAQNYAMLDDNLSVNPESLIETRYCVPKFDLSKMDYNFWQKVVSLQDALKMTANLRINSAYRSKSHDLSRGRTGSSQHCFGRAVDISCMESGFRWILIREAMRIGFHRVLVYPTFIHLDDKPGSYNKLIWMKG